MQGLASPRIVERGAALVVATAADGDVAVTLDAAELDVRQVSGMDPWLGLVEVTGTCPAGAAQHLAPDLWPQAARTDSSPCPTSWSGRPAPCSSWPGPTPSSGSSSATPSGPSRLSATDSPTPWWPSRRPAPPWPRPWDDPAPTAAAVAKALAGHAAHTAARHGQQVLAGIGFTTEHPLQRYVRRVLVLDELFGSSRSLTREIGRQLIEARRLPPPPRL